MIDLHAHLLWDWDDGPDTWVQSLQMCRTAVKDGITAICLTPHIFRLSRHGDDLTVLRDRMVEFKREMARTGLEFHWGAEVFVQPELVQAIEKYRFTIDETSYVFIELPPGGVPVGSRSTLGSLLGKGFVPIISHPERNMSFAKRPELLYEFVQMGCVAQVTAGSLTGDFGREARAAAGLFLVNNLVHIIASDAHAPSGRMPILSRGVAAAAKIVGEPKALAMVNEVPRAILDNQVLPDWGEPQNPLQHKTWTRRLFARPKTGPGGAPAGPKTQKPFVFKINR